MATHPPTPGPARPSRTIRVFVSSTFRDMHAERDELAKRVFPRLRKLCESRGVAWGDVDLRWGITDEQRAEGQVLPLILAEIRRCQPYFIGLLGERYGWVPDAIAGDLGADERWLRNQDGRSITELEILHGVLNNPSMAEHAFFYLRDPRYVDGLPAERQPDFREDTDAPRNKLEDLKQRIRSSGLPVREGFANAEELGRLVLADLTAVIDRLFPEGSQPDNVTREAAEHEVFAAARARVYVERRDTFARLDAFAHSSEVPLVITGDSGAGKSALLANWAASWRRRATAAPVRRAWFGRLFSKPDQAPVLLHFVGATAASARWTAIAERLLRELDSHFSLGLTVPDRPEDLRRALASGLQKAAGRGRVVIVLDGLDHLESRDGGAELGWLPAVLPDGIRLIVSTLQGPTLEELRRRRWTELRVEPLSREERSVFIREYLEQYGRRLDQGRVDRLAAAPAAGSPLYLRTVLEELRLWGDHETLGERIDYYLSAASVDELYEKVLARYEADYERERPRLVSDAFSLLWAARRGLSESELLDLLGGDSGPMPRAFWSPLYLAAEASLANQSGLLTFFHDYLRRAVERRYLGAPARRAAAHERLASYFERRLDAGARSGTPLEERVRHVLDGRRVTAEEETNVRRLLGAYTLGAREVDELAWQLAGAGEWDRLARLLARPDFACTAWTVDRSSMVWLWREVTAHTAITPAAAYAPVIQDVAAYEAHALDIARLLEALGDASSSRTLLERLIAHARRAGDRWNLAFALTEAAIVYVRRGEVREAASAEREARELFVQLGLGPPGALALTEGDALQLQGRFADALHWYEREAEEASRQGDDDRLAKALGNQATACRELGDLSAAMDLHVREEAICRRLDNRYGLQVSLGNRAVIHRERGELDTAWALLAEKERVCEAINERRGLAYAWHEQALVLSQRDDTERALELLRRVEAACRESDDAPLLESAVGNQGAILARTGHGDEALEKLREQERLANASGNRKAIAQSLANQAVVFKANGRFDEALAAMQQQEQLCREMRHMKGLAIALFNEASVLGPDLGRYQEAEEKAREAVAIASRHGFVDLANRMSAFLEMLGS